MTGMISRTIYVPSEALINELTIAIARNYLNGDTSRLQHYAREGERESLGM